MTRTTSPRSSRLAMDPASTPRGARTTSSCTFVSSRTMVTERCAPRTTARSASVAAVRSGDSKQMTVAVDAATSSIHAERSRPLRGGKPTKVNRSVACPDTTSAERAAVGPGMIETARPARCAASTNRLPGSAIPGMPASLTKATRFPEATRVRTASICVCSLWSCTAHKRRGEVSAPIADRRARVRRVSSQQMTAASLKMAFARSERSPKFPIGVATSTKQPLAVVDGSRSAVLTSLLIGYDIHSYVEANCEAQAAGQEEGQPRQEAELRSRLILSTPARSGHVPRSRQPSRLGNQRSVRQRPCRGGAPLWERR